jgi:hypothetical protein
VTGTEGVYKPFLSGVYKSGPHRRKQWRWLIIKQARGKKHPIDENDLDPGITRKNARGIPIRIVYGSKKTL